MFVLVVHQAFDSIAHGPQPGSPRTSLSSNRPDETISVIALMISMACSAVDFALQNAHHVIVT